MEGAEDMRNKRVVVAVDEGEESMQALSWCLSNLLTQIACGIGSCSLVLLYVKPPPPVYSTLDPTGYFFAGDDAISDMKKYGSNLANSVMNKAESICRKFNTSRDRNHPEPPRIVGIDLNLENGTHSYYEKSIPFGDNSWLESATVEIIPPATVEIIHRHRQFVRPVILQLTGAIEDDNKTPVEESQEHAAGRGVAGARRRSRSRKSTPPVEDDNKTTIGVWSNRTKLLGMMKTSGVLVFFIALAVVFTLSRSDPDQTPSDFPSEELIKYGFPIGLLQTNVKGYSLNQTTGSFVLFLDDKCRITLPPDNYLATYSKKIVSPSSTGSASGLSSSGGASPESDPAATTWCSRHTGSEFESGSNANAIKHDEDVDYTEGSISLTGRNFDRVAHRYDPEMDGRILLRKVDCTEEVDLCRRDLEAGEDHRRPTVRFAEAEWRRMAEIDERCTLVARFVKERPPLELIRARIGEVVSLEGGSCSETETEIVEEAVSKVKGKKVVSVVGDKGEDRAEKLGSKQCVKCDVNGEAMKGGEDANIHVIKERVGDDVSKVAGVVNFSGNQQQEKGNFNTLCANMQQMVIKARESEQCVKPKGKENGDMATGKFLTQFTKAMTALIQDSIEKKERKGKEGGAKSSVSAQARVKDVSEGSSKGERVFKNTMDLVKVVEEFMKKDKVLDEKVKEALKEVNTYLWTVYDKEKEEYIEEGINRAMRAATIFLVKAKHCPSWGSENGLLGRYLKANIDSVGARICYWAVSLDL
nr:universal stress protein A-like protein [Ipomoea batatas]